MLPDAGSYDFSTATPQPQPQPQPPTSGTPEPQDDYFTQHKAYWGTWYVWVAGGWTASDPATGISTYTKGAAGGQITLDPYGTFVWEQNNKIYKGVYASNPYDPSKLTMRDTDGWVYTLMIVDDKTVKWSSYGLDYYGTRD